MGTFLIQGNEFVLDGKPFRILSGAVHYFRVPRPYWEDRLHKARLMGLNTVETYVAWNLHEPRPGEFHFEDNLDLCTFINTAVDCDLRVILRPGPYICSEWDFGGLPAWLLKDPDMRVRSTYPPYLQVVERWFATLLPQLVPLQVSRDGPILMMQVENEYGNYGSDKNYLTRLVEMLRENGIDTPLFTADWKMGDRLQAGSLEGLLTAVNFGAGPVRAFRKLRKYQPHGPLMCVEFWNGWFNHWGLWHNKRTPSRKARIYDRMLKMGASVNLYMWHGGTSFGFMNGANNIAGLYLADVSSYDYDAPLSECGDLTQKYHALRKVIQKYAPVPQEAFPTPALKLELGSLPVEEGRSFWDTLPALAKPVRLPHPVPMEALDQSHGFILYRTFLRGPVDGKLSISGVRDRAQVFLDGLPLGILTRNLPGRKLRLQAPSGETRLDILVENMGRVNFGRNLQDRKGILGDILLGRHALFDWEVYTLPLVDLSGLVYEPLNSTLKGPAFYRVVFHIDAPLDGFLALPGWTKGAAWINGFNLGRYWKIGPQKSLYVPAPLLRKGKNEIVIFELQGTSKLQVELRNRPK